MKKFVILAVAGLLLVVSAATASAGHQSPSIAEINKSAAGGWACEDGVKVDPVETGWYGGVYVEVDGDTFSFSTADDVLVTAVIVKGGKNANLYIYGSTHGDYGLHAPDNAKSGKYYGLSHLCFMTSTKGGGGHSKNT